jgi:hypothetical protein
MEEIIFTVQGSAAEPYTVLFLKNGPNLTARCTCPAGAVGQYCKHRIRILEGSDEGIVSGNENAVNKVVSWLPGTAVEKALGDVRASEIRLELAKSELTGLKKKLARVLSD